jgi:hypothetical protein
MGGGLGPRLPPVSVPGVFEQNRVLGGCDIVSNHNPISHTFVFTTNPDGSLCHTYSWGNAYDDPNGSHWFKDHPNDVSAAREAISCGGGVDQVGNAALIPYIDQAFAGLDSPYSASCHGNPGFTIWFSTCKEEAMRLEIDARKLQQGQRNLDDFWYYLPLGPSQQGGGCGNLYNQGP